MTAKLSAYLTYGAPVKVAAARKKKDKKTGISMPAALALGLGAGGAAYAGLRRFSPSAIPELAALQNKAKDLRFQMATSNNKGRTLRSILLGAPDVEPLAKNAPDSAVLHHTWGKGPGVGGVDINKGVLPEALDDKWSFHQVMTQGTGGPAGPKNIVPHTRLLHDALGEVRGDRAALNKMFPEGYVIKPRSGAMSKAEALLTHETDPNDRRLREALANPKAFIIQEKLPIDQEYRVHTVNNVPLTAAYRQFPNETLRALWNKHTGDGGGAFFPVLGGERKELMDFVRNATQHVGVGPEGNMLGVSENLHHGLDVVRLRDGSFRVLESNPQPGTFMNPIVSRRVQQAVTGRVPKDVAALGALGAGSAAALGAYGLSNQEAA